MSPRYGSIFNIRGTESDWRRRKRDVCCFEHRCFSIETTIECAAHRIEIVNVSHKYALIYSVWRLQYVSFGCCRSEGVERLATTWCWLYFSWLVLNQSRSVEIWPDSLIFTEMSPKAYPLWMTRHQQKKQNKRTQQISSRVVTSRKKEPQSNIKEIHKSFCSNPSQLIQPAIYNLMSMSIHQLELFIFQSEKRRMQCKFMDDNNAQSINGMENDAICQENQFTIRQFHCVRRCLSIQDYRFDI